VCLYVCVCVRVQDFGWCGQFDVIDHSQYWYTSQTSPYLHRSFSANEPYNEWPICGKRIATWGILCIFATLHGYTSKTSTLVFKSHFSQKSPVIHDSFADRDLQFKESYASSPPCIDILVETSALFFEGHFPQKSPIIRGSFAERDLRGILWIFATLNWYTFQTSSLQSSYTVNWEFPVQILKSLNLLCRT